MQTADNLIRSMKKQTDALVASDEKLQQFLTWVSQKSRSVTATSKPAATRVFYFSRIRAYLFDLARADSSDFGRVFDPAFTLSYDLLLDRELDRLLAFTFSRPLDLNEALCNIIIFALYYPINRRPSAEDIFGFTLTNPYDSRAVVASTLCLSLQLLRTELPNLNNNHERFKQWWKANGQVWREQLRTVMIECRNIGHDWQFRNEQKELIEQYFDANLLLVNCLKRAAHVAPAVRKEIEETLLLPIAEIEQRVRINN